MLYVFSTNQVKLVARKLKTTNNMGQREYTTAGSRLALEHSAALVLDTNLINCSRHQSADSTDDRLTLVLASFASLKSHS
jgi:hypothetical protein